MPADTLRTSKLTILEFKRLAVRSVSGSEVPRPIGNSRCTPLYDYWAHSEKLIRSVERKANRLDLAALTVFCLSL